MSANIIYLDKYRSLKNTIQYSIDPKPTLQKINETAEQIRKELLKSNDILDDEQLIEVNICDNSDADESDTNAPSPFDLACKYNFSIDGKLINAGYRIYAEIPINEDYFKKLARLTNKIGDEKTIKRKTINRKTGKAVMIIYGKN